MNDVERSRLFLVIMPSLSSTRLTRTLTLNSTGRAYFTTAGKSSVPFLWQARLISLSTHSYGLPCSSPFGLSSADPLGQVLVDFPGPIRQLLRQIFTKLRPSGDTHVFRMTNTVRNKKSGLCCVRMCRDSGAMGSVPSVFQDLCRLVDRI